MGRWDRTHEALRQAALELFSEQGYEATGAAQVAAHAGVSEMTLFRCFPTKEALLDDDPFDPMIAEAVRSRLSNEPTMRAVAEGIRDALGRACPETQAALGRLAARALFSGGITAAVAWVAP